MLVQTNDKVNRNLNLQVVQKYKSNRAKQGRENQVNF